MNRRFVLVAALSLLPLSAYGAEPAPDAAKKTLGEIRNIGTALFSWLTDQEIPASGEQGKGEEPTIDVSTIPVISHAELAKLLVPNYLVVLPVNDGWGNPYEFRLNRASLGGIPVTAIRSAGKDGEFSGSVYSKEAFPMDDPDQDLVWVDGYFARWPQPKK